MVVRPHELSMLMLIQLMLALTNVAVLPVRDG